MSEIIFIPPKDDKEGAKNFVELMAKKLNEHYKGGDNDPDCSLLQSING